MVNRLLDISIDNAIRGCRDIFKQFDDFTELRQNALTDMCFNLGAFGLLGFKRMRKAIMAGDWNEAAEQVRDSDYWRQLGGDPKGQDDGKLERPEEIAAMLREG
jgi:GH24 family phage-related lysozyme (muramidase)